MRVKPNKKEILKKLIIDDLKMNGFVNVYVYGIIPKSKIVSSLKRLFVDEKNYKTADVSIIHRRNRRRYKNFNNIISLNFSDEDDTFWTYIHFRDVYAELKLDLSISSFKKKILFKKFKLLKLKKNSILIGGLESKLSSRNKKRRRKKNKYIRYVSTKLSSMVNII